MPLCATSKLLYSFSISEQIGTRKEMAKVSLKEREKATEIRIGAQTDIPGCWLCNNIHFINLHLCSSLFYYCSFGYFEARSSILLWLVWNSSCRSGWLRACTGIPASQLWLFLSSKQVPRPSRALWCLSDLERSTSHHPVPQSVHLDRISHEAAASLPRTAGYR